MENARPTFSGKDKDQKVGTLIFCHFSIIEMICGDLHNKLK
jgi:hypothetical protein